MRYLLTLIILFSFLSKSRAQKKLVSAEILTAKQQAAFCTDSLLSQFNIRYPIYKVYKFIDKSGTYYCLLTESDDEINTNGDTLSHHIKAILLKAVADSFTGIWEINDHIVKDERDENSIWFWTKYMEFKDYNGDGLIDPVIIYGTSGMNGYDDGRIKFIIYFNGQKIAIRHQNGVLDSERETQVDKAFYNLPAALQSAIQEKMELMMENKHAIFPAGWDKAMKNKKTFFSERN